jgi:hypothetical protein
MFPFVGKGNQYIMTTIPSITRAQRTKDVTPATSLDESIATMPYFCQADAFDALISNDPKTIFAVFGYDSDSDGVSLCRSERKQT